MCSSDLDEARLVLEEREEERKRLIGDLWEIDRLASERDSKIGQLSYAVDHATARLADRDRIIAERDELIGQLRAGLAHAETLAFARAAELQRIHSSRLWRYVGYLRRVLRRTTA